MKCKPAIFSLPSSNAAPSSRWTSFKRAIKYSVSMSVSMIRFLFLRSQHMLTTSVPANQLARASARLVKITIPDTNESAGRSLGTGHNLPIPMFSSVTPPPGKNSAKGKPTKAYFSPLSASGSLIGALVSKNAGLALAGIMDALKPSMLGYTFLFRSSNHEPNENVHREGLPATSNSDRAMLIMLNMAPRKKRIIRGFVSDWSIRFSTTLRSSFELT
mmetsp:Transcript_36080/g.51044  ORF Transcript_36080/g.51044 Transcript_36080/m.51044 type:complete len:217 (+) Transcript_36080:690-1340(+)